MNEQDKFAKEMLHAVIKFALLERWRISQRTVGGGNGLFLPGAKRIRDRLACKRT